jgi:hypothetical protein
MEKEELLTRWHVLRSESGDVIVSPEVLEERLVILHRLNELGEYDIGGLSLVKALEETNVLMREQNCARHPWTGFPSGRNAIVNITWFSRGDLEITLRGAIARFRVVQDIALHGVFTP